MEVLVQPAIAYLGKAEHPLDDPDRMFDPGPHFGLGAVFRPLDLIDNTAVGLVTPHPGLLPMQQIGKYRTVGDIGGCRTDGVDQLGAAFFLVMRLPPKTPLVPYMTLVY